MKEVDFYQFDLSQFNPGANDCNFAIVINPKLYPLYKEQRCNRYDVKSYNEWLERLFASSSILDSLTAEIGPDHRLISITAERKHQEDLKSPIENIVSRLVWDEEKGTYLTKGVKYYLDFILMLHLLIQEMKHWLGDIGEKEGNDIVLPWMVEVGPPFRNCINIQTSVNFNSRVRKLLTDRPDFKAELWKGSASELGQREMSWLIYSKHRPPATFSEEDTELEKIEVLGNAAMLYETGGLPAFTPYQHGGTIYSCHNIDRSHQSSFILLIFWLFDKMIREHYSVDFF